jgi:hypothetical protein
MKIKILIAFFAFIISSHSFARDFDDCLITDIFLDNASLANVKIDCPISNRPSCAGTDNYFALDKETEAGKQIYSLMLMAFAANMKISGFIVNDQNSCPVWQPNIPMLRWITVKK